ncbi:MAG: hypothetical protein R6W73_02600 [Candidatus Saliniplasma sp.]
MTRNIQTEKIYGGGIYPGTIESVHHKIGPTYDVDGALEEMEENPRMWLPEEVNQYIDMEDLTKIPGRLAVYRLVNNRYLITYTYLAPYPIAETYGFIIAETEEGNSTLLPLKHSTLIYPNTVSQPDDLI